MADRKPPTDTPFPEVLKVARWLVEATGYPYDLCTSVVPSHEVQVAVYHAWIEKEGIMHDPVECAALWDGLCDEGGWAT